MKFLLSFFNQAQKQGQIVLPLEYSELNPLLAKQLTEVEIQLGQLASIQYELAEERRRMAAEMDALKKLVLDGTASLKPVSATT